MKAGFVDDGRDGRGLGRRGVVFVAAFEVPKPVADLTPPPASVAEYGTSDGRLGGRAGGGELESLLVCLPEEAVSVGWELLLLLFCCWLWMEEEKFVAGTPLRNDRRGIGGGVEFRYFC